MTWTRRLAALPARVWATVAALALVGSVALALVLSAGLQVWRGAVGRSASEPPRLTLPPGSGQVTVPGAARSTTGGRGRLRLPGRLASGGRAARPATGAAAPTTPAAGGGGRSTAVGPAAGVASGPVPESAQRGAGLRRFLRLPLVPLSASTISAVSTSLPNLFNLTSPFSALAPQVAVGPGGGSDEPAPSSAPVHRHEHAGEHRAVRHRLDRHVLGRHRAGTRAAVGDRRRHGQAGGRQHRRGHAHGRPDWAGARWAAGRVPNDD